MVCVATPRKKMNAIKTKIHTQQNKKIETTHQSFFADRRSVIAEQKDLSCVVNYDTNTGIPQDRDLSRNSVWEGLEG